MAREGSVKNVSIDPNTHTLLDILLTDNQATVITLTSDASIWDTTVDVSAWHGFVAWDELIITEWVRWYQWPVTSVSVNTLTLWIPINVAYTIAWASLTRWISEIWGVVWSLASPAIYSISAAGPFFINIHRMLLEMTDATDMDDTTFWGLAALTNWIAFRIFRDSSGTFSNLFNIKTNWEFALRSFDAAYADKAWAWSFWFRVRRSFWWENNNGSIIKLEEWDRFEVIIQDSLVWLDSFKVVVQWNVTF